MQLCNMRLGKYCFLQALGVSYKQLALSTGSSSQHHGTFKLQHLRTNIPNQAFEDTKPGFAYGLVDVFLEVPINNKNDVGKYHFYPFLRLGNFCTWSCLESQAPELEPVKVSKGRIILNLPMMVVCDLELVI